MDSNLVVDAAEKEQPLKYTLVEYDDLEDANDSKSKICDLEIAHDCDFDSGFLCYCYCYCYYYCPWSFP